MRKVFNLFFFLLFVFCPLFSLEARERIEIGSKSFTESYILGEILAQIIESEFPEREVKRRLGMGGTGLVFQALKSDKIDLYVDYTGTLSQVILKNPALTNEKSIRSELEALEVRMSRSLGFNNTYAFVMPKALATNWKISSMSEFARLPTSRLKQIHAAFSYEFLEREDGFYAAAAHYGFELTRVRAVEHAIAYEALRTGSVNFGVSYTTDAKLQELDLQVLEDDKDFFPEYKAVILASQGFIERHPEVWAKLKERLENQVSEKQMMSLNAFVDTQKQSYANAASRFVSGDAIVSESDQRQSLILWEELKEKTLEHIVLVFMSLIAAVFVGVPLGILAMRSHFLKQLVLSSSGLIQTVPSLALLVLFIPILGVGQTSSLVAIFLYALLPIVRNTYAGFSAIDRTYVNAAQVLGLNWWQRIWFVELPLSSISIFAGIKTSAVISVGTATLAAFIGGGGYGEFIIQGLAMTNTKTILHGAIPAIIMALVVQYSLDIFEKYITPRGMKVSFQQPQ